ncbi:hypothetical protein CQ040_20190 [Microbacterium sp. MYb54]|nr:hypothetical protein CQ032_20175 [Microbacterium sp. MYb43]PQZ69246.1 hypothetical protein CQ031_20125 [Microbacterium sp. MYb40]PRB13968.1 hypothetical protein CQ040_20190 [Microbacterium sp. MYb54]PRB20055.1 hypothetical protein CQ037_20120 [Microbacterium sp. MYb50]PRB57796.1 hypothetical protein CQ021_20165 [Microbacterium sp. MYb24]
MIEAVAPEVLSGVTEEGFVEVPADAADGLAFSTDGGDIVIGLPRADAAAPAERLDSDVVAFDNGDSSTTVPLVRGEDAVQILTVIENASAPTEYVYDFTLPDGASIVAAEDGYYGIVDADGTPLAMIAPPWAKDANGADLNTRFEIRGSTIIQVVDHGPGTAYPVVADPIVKGTLIKSIGLVGDPRGTIVSVMPKTTYPGLGRSFDDYYVEYKLWVNATYTGQKYRDQLVCHVANAPTKTPWNLDSWRPNVGYNLTVLALCNPN